MKKFFFNKLSSMRTRGFVLPLTLVVCVIILTIATGISIILAKELYFSKLSRLSQVAYFAADNGLMCATMIDDKYIDPETGLGIFQYNNLVTSQMVLDKTNITRASKGLSPLTLNDLTCATSEVFNSTVTGYAVTSFTRNDSAGNPDNGQTTTFNMKMDLGNGEYRCATVQINKTTIYRQIISRGFASCNSVFQYPIERAIVSTSESSGIAVTPPPPPPPPASTVHVVRTSGTSWTVPAGVTTLKVWAVGAGGGGAGSNGFDTAVGGGGGAGGVAYREYTVTPGDVVSYTLGTAGTPGGDITGGGDGGNTVVTVAGGSAIQALGGKGGQHNNGLKGLGGDATGGTSNRKGGDGPGVSGNTGGSGGGGIGEVDGSLSACGGTGGQASDINGLFAVLVAAGYPTTAPGAGYGCNSTNPNNQDGFAATGFGSGGGGAGSWGGNGGSGLYGGGGGGAAGYTANFKQGGTGGQGVVVISD